MYNLVLTNNIHKIYIDKYQLNKVILPLKKKHNNVFDEYKNKEHL